MRPNFVMLIIALPLAAGCFSSQGGEDTASIAEALELPHGGLDMEDEEPAFGLDGELAALQLSAGELIEDPMDADRELRQMGAEPDAVVYHTAVQWGRFPFDRDATDPESWTGRLVVNRGGILVRRVVAFEPRTDHLLPRVRRNAVSFTSATLPHRDGLVLSIIDPDPFTDEPLVLRYEPADGREGASVRVARLVEEPTVLFDDGSGNRMLSGATAVPHDLCAHGFLAGRWQQLEPGLGRLLGVVTGADGDPRGHVRGIYGERRSGEPVFFGKYIDREGRFRGIFAGRYGEGTLAGRWLTRAGEIGALAGRYRGADPSHGPLDGPFLARWSEVSCGDRI